MRQITTHHINECNRHIALLDADPDEPSHTYRIAIAGTPEKPPPKAQPDLSFQNGPIKEAGVNGLTNEVLLAVLIDRMEHFQRGEFRCRENALVLTKLQEAMHWLDHRTREREERGVEGTHTP